MWPCSWLDMVGPGGTVVGVERDMTILQTARARSPPQQDGRM